ncbi:MAG TPA: carbonic anhydrase [Guyparkeria sp.]|nr:carbonic anhydrase [Guyparkeria sp.]
MDPIQQLIDGFAAFSRRRYGEGGPFKRLITEGQSPRIALVACSDSRVDPSLTLDCDPGDLFVIRNVGALVPPYQPHGASYHGTSAALEYAVTNLKVDHLIVMGHALCGGINTLVRGGPYDPESFIGRWVGLAQPALERAQSNCDHHDQDSLRRCCELESVRLSYENLMTFPWVRDQVEKSELQVHGWYFDLVAGLLLGLDEQSKRFATLTKE